MNLVATLDVRQTGFKVTLSHLVSRCCQLLQRLGGLLDSSATSKEHHNESYQDEEQQQSSYDITDYINEESGNHHNHRPRGVI